MSWHLLSRLRVSGRWHIKRESRWVRDRHVAPNADGRGMCSLANCMYVGILAFAWRSRAHECTTTLSISSTAICGSYKGSLRWHSTTECQGLTWSIMDCWTSLPPPQSKKKTILWLFQNWRERKFHHTYITSCLWNPLECCKHLSSICLGDSKNFQLWPSFFFQTSRCKSSTSLLLTASFLLGPRRVVGRDLSKFLSAFYWCAKADSPCSVQTSASLAQNSAGLSFKTTFLKQYAARFLCACAFARWVYADVSMCKEGPQNRGAPKICPPTNRGFEPFPTTYPARFWQISTKSDQKATNFTFFVLWDNEQPRQRRTNLNKFPAKR